MFIHHMRGRPTSDAVDENRFLIYSPEWYFARYTNLMKHDEAAKPPIRFGLTLADALAFVDKDVGWKGVLSDLKYEWALAAHRAMHWKYSRIGLVYSFSPVTVDLLMIFKQRFGDEQTADIIEKKIRQLHKFRGYPENEGTLEDVTNDITRALSATHASVLFHNLIYSAIIDRAIELNAEADVLSRLVYAKYTSDAVVRSYSSN